MVGGEGGDGGEDGERGEGGSEDVQQVVVLLTGATRCGARTGHGCVLTWSDLRSSHHHQHDATEANTTTTICVLHYYSLQLPVTRLQTTNTRLSVLDTIIVSSPPDHSTIALSYNSL